MPSMRAVQVSKPNGPFEVVAREMREPGRGEVRIKVEACGICHSDAATRSGAFPGLTLPRVPGHEIAGRVDAVGANVKAWKVGERVGVGWHGGHCFHCTPCRKGASSTASTQDHRHHLRRRLRRIRGRSRSRRWRASRKSSRPPRPARSSAPA